MDKNVMPGNRAKDGVSIKTIAVDLPPPHTNRWVPRRKAAIVNAVRSGAISLEEVCHRYQLSVEEFLTWQRAIETHGVTGLRVTRVRIYRGDSPARPSSGAPERPAAAGGSHYVESVWGSGDVLPDPAAMPAATLVVAPEDLGARRDGAGTRAAEERTVGKAYRPNPQGAPRLGQIEHQRTRCRDGVRDHPVGQARAPGIRPGTKSTRVSFPVEMRFEDAVTTDGGPLHLPRPDPVRSLFGCATARCDE
jgi:hypothetical protein